MKPAITGYPIKDYQVTTPVYEGPLDLLLHLIERAELDITRVSLAQVTDQYLAHLKALPNQDPDEVSSFLVIAAKLLQIKSEALLPRPPVREEGEEDPGEALANQLVIYKRFKELSEILEKREKAGLRTYLRLATPPKVAERVDLSDFTLEDIVAAARQAFLEIDNRQALGTVVTAPRVTIREKIRMIVNSVRKGSTSFSKLLGRRRSRLDVVVTFLAMLELVKRHYILARQETLFGDITLDPTTNWEENIEFDLEFGE